jgi:hypothetical protein
MEGEFLGSAAHLIPGMIGAAGSIVTASVLHYNDKIAPEETGMLALGGSLIFMIWPIVLTVAFLAALLAIPVAACWFAPLGIIKLRRYIQGKSPPKPLPGLEYDPILHEAKEEVDQFLGETQ